MRRTQTVGETMRRSKLRRPLSTPNGGFAHGRLDEARTPAASCALGEKFAKDLSLNRRPTKAKRENLSRPTSLFRHVAFRHSDGCPNLGDAGMVKTSPPHAIKRERSQQIFFSLDGLTERRASRQNQDLRDSPIERSRPKSACCPYSVQRRSGYGETRGMGEAKSCKSRQSHKS